MKKILGLTLVAILGCNGDKNTTETEGGSSGGSTGEASGTTATTATTGPTSGNATDDSGTGSGGVTDAESSGVASVTDGTGSPTTGGETAGGETTGGTTGGGGEGLMAECKAVCDVGETCMLDTGGPACVMDCVDEFAGAMGECQTAIDGYLVCLANMSCMELNELDMSSDPGPCTDAVTAFLEACDMGGECLVGVDSNPQGTQCSITEECPGEPLREMQCDKNECVCLVDGMEVGTCPSDMICMTPEELQNKATDCCNV